MTKADRQQFLTIGAAAAAAATTMLPGSLQAEHHKEAASSADGTVRPPASGKRILLSVKLGMIPKKIDGKELTLNQRLLMAKEAGLDAASLGQPILIENVWNQMFYDHGGSPDQGAERFVDFVDSFQSPWVGMYYDIGNHWKYGQPGEWIRAFGHRCFKLDVKGFSRARNKFTEIGEGDLPWDQVRQGLADINFTGWATAEVGGGDVKRLTKVREQMQNVFGLA